MQTSFIRSVTLAAAASFLAAPTLFAQGGGTSAPMRVAYVNSQKILAEAPGRAEAEATYDKEMGSVKAELQRMQDSLKTMMESYQKQASGLDSTKRAALGKTFQDREDEFQQRAQTLNQKMQDRQAELARPLMDQVSKVLDEMRVQGNYAMIFDVGAPGSGVVSADKSLDLTDQVLTRLKQLGPPKAAAVSSTPAPAPAVGPTARPAGVSRPRG